MIPFQTVNQILLEAAYAVPTCRPYLLESIEVQCQVCRKQRGHRETLPLSVHSASNCNFGLEPRVPNRPTTHLA